MDCFFENNVAWLWITSPGLRKDQPWVMLLAPPFRKTVQKPPVVGRQLFVLSPREVLPFSQVSGSPPSQVCALPIESTRWPPSLFLSWTRGGPNNVSVPSVYGKVSKYGSYHMSCINTSAMLSRLFWVWARRQEPNVTYTLHSICLASTLRSRRIQRSQMPACRVCTLLCVWGRKTSAWQLDQLSGAIYSSTRRKRFMMSCDSLEPVVVMICAFFRLTDWEDGTHQDQPSFQTGHICWSCAAVELLICNLIELRADFILIIKFTVTRLISQNCSLPQWFHVWHFSSALAETCKHDAERCVMWTQRAKLGKCWASDIPHVSVSGYVNTVMYVINASKGALYVQMICISG